VKLPTSLEETVQLRAVPAAEPVAPAAERVAEPVVDQPVRGELPTEPGAHRQAAPMGKRKQVVLGAAAAVVVLSVGGLVLFGGSGGKNDEPTAGQPAPAVVAPPTSSTAEPAPSTAAGTLAVPTTKVVASAEVRAEPKTPTTTSSAAPKETKTSESVDPRAGALSSLMQEFEDKYGKPSQPRR
jgi:hypothetical protein